MIIWYLKLLFLIWTVVGKNSKEDHQVIVDIFNGSVLNQQKLLQKISHTQIVRLNVLSKIVKLSFGLSILIPTFIMVMKFVQWSVKLIKIELIRTFTISKRFNLYLTFSLNILFLNCYLIFNCKFNFLVSCLLLKIQLYRISLILAHSAQLAQSAQFYLLISQK